MRQLLLSLTLLALAPLQVAAEPRYTITDLGAFTSGPGSYSSPSRINDAGQVIGSSRGADQQFHSFLYSGGTLTEPQKLPGETSIGLSAINNLGQAVGGTIGKTAAGEYQHPFVYSGGMVQELGTLSPGDAVDINDSGVILGTKPYGDSFVYTGGDWHDLGISGAMYINASGQLAGTRQSPTLRAFFYTDGRLVDLAPLPGFEESIARGLNNLGDVVGDAESSGKVGGHAFLYHNGNVIDINGSLPHVLYAAADGINDSGQVVGWGSYQGGIPLAFIYQDGKTTDLSTLISPASGWTLLGADGINNHGQIAGVGIDAAGETHALILTPIPEPQAVALLAFAGAMLVRRRGRGK